MDYNRAGIPLVEIVTKPVPGTGALAPEVARAYVTELRDILRTLGVSDVRMEQGSLRCDVNTSLTPLGAAEWGTRTETKNVNSLRSVERAVRSEMIRQAGGARRGAAGGAGDPPLLRDDRRHPPGRSKEEATDYRYFPEPDLVPDGARAGLGGVAARDAAGAAGRAPGPDASRTRSRRRRTAPAGQRRRGRSRRRHGRLRRTGGRGEQLVAGLPGAAGERARYRRRGSADHTCPGRPAHTASGCRELSVGLARQAVDGVLETGGDVDTVVAERGLRIVSDAGALERAADDAITANPDIAEKVRGGKLPAVGALVGAVMKATGGQADASAVREILLTKLGAG